jgi:hypothetical protein
MSGSPEEIEDRVRHAFLVERVLLWLGWSVVVVGVVGMAVFIGFWVVGDLTAEQGVSLVLGTTLATVLAGAGAYGAGVNVGLGAERLRLAAAAGGGTTGDPARGRDPRVDGGATGGDSG